MVKKYYIYGLAYFLLVFAVVQISVAYSGHHIFSHHLNLRDNKYDIKMSSGTKTREEDWKKYDEKHKNKEEETNKKALEEKNKNK